MKNQKRRLVYVRPQRYSELAISTVLMVQRLFRLILRAAQGFIDSILP